MVHHPATQALNLGQHSTIARLNKCVFGMKNIKAYLMKLLSLNCHLSLKETLFNDHFKVKYKTVSYNLFDISPNYKFTTVLVTTTVLQ